MQKKPPPQFLLHLGPLFVGHIVEPTTAEKGLATEQLKSNREVGENAPRLTYANISKEPQNDPKTSAPSIAASHRSQLSGHLGCDGNGVEGPRGHEANLA